MPSSRTIRSERSITRTQQTPNLARASSAYRDVLIELRTIDRWRSLSEMVGWDKEANLQRAAHPVRIDQIQLIEEQLHALQSSRGLLDRARYAQEMNRHVGDPQAERLLTLVGSNYDAQAAMPHRLASELGAAKARTLSRWERAREANDFSIVSGALGELVALSREKGTLLCEALGDAEPYDVFIGAYEPGMTGERLTALFSELSSGLERIVGRVEKRNHRKIPAPYSWGSPRLNGKKRRS